MGLSAEIEEIEDEDNLVRHAHPTNPGHILEAADGSNDDNNPSGPNIMETDDEEPKKTAEDELSKSVPVQCHCLF